MEIEGTGNLYKLAEFLDPNSIKKDVNIAEYEDYIMINEPSKVDFGNPNEIYSDIMRMLGGNKSAPPLRTQPRPQYTPPSTPSQRPTTQPHTPPQQPKPEPPNTERISQNFDFSRAQQQQQPQQPPAPPMNSYERANFNKLIYSGRDGGGNVEDSETEKMRMLESITSLRDELSTLKIDIASIPQVSHESSYYDIKNVLKLLLHKKNITVHYETARDFMLIGVNQLINYCDGSQTSWGRRPNLKGWDRTAKLKLNTLKTELSTLAGDFFNYYDIGALGQIALSLIPSAIIHATYNSRQSSVHTDNDEALQSLRDL